MIEIIDIVYSKWYKCNSFWCTPAQESPSSERFRDDSFTSHSRIYELCFCGIFFGNRNFVHQQKKCKANDQNVCAPTAQAFLNAFEYIFNIDKSSCRHEWSMVFGYLLWWLVCPSAFNGRLSVTTRSERKHLKKIETEQHTQREQAVEFETRKQGLEQAQRIVSILRKDSDDGAVNRPPDLLKL